MKLGEKEWNRWAAAIAVVKDDLDVAIGKLDDLACKYVCLLTGKSYSSLQATVQFDWKRIFSVPFNRPA